MDNLRDGLREIRVTEEAQRSLEADRREMAKVWLARLKTEVDNSKLAAKLGMTADFDGVALTVETPTLLEIGRWSAHGEEVRFGTRMYEDLPGAELRPQRFSSWEALWRHFVVLVNRLCTADLEEVERH